MKTLLVILLLSGVATAIGMLAGWILWHAAQWFHRIALPHLRRGHRTEYAAHFRRVRRTPLVVLALLCASPALGGEPTGPAVKDGPKAAAKAAPKALALKVAQPVVHNDLSIPDPAVVAPPPATAAVVPAQVPGSDVLRNLNALQAALDATRAQLGVPPVAVLPPEFWNSSGGKALATVMGILAAGVSISTVTIQALHETGKL